MVQGIDRVPDRLWVNYELRSVYSEGKEKHQTSWLEHGKEGANKWRGVWSGNVVVRKIWRAAVY